MKKLLKRIKEIETLIVIYSDRDVIRVQSLESELKKLNKKVLLTMTRDNESFLRRVA